MALQSPCVFQETYTIRNARSDDVAKLGDIERSAGQLFRTVGLDAVADDEPMPPKVLSMYLEAENLWLAQLQETEEVVAFLAVFPIVNEQIKEAETERRFLHIAELSVHAEHQRKGLAKRLLRILEQNGRREGVSGLSLTTYRDVSFNGPFYERMGFREVAVREIETVIGTRGKELWEEEQGKIEQKERRCWMVKWLDGQVG